MKPPFSTLFQEFMDILLSIALMVLIAISILLLSVVIIFLYTILLRIKKSQYKPSKINISLRNMSTEYRKSLTDINADICEGNKKKTKKNKKNYRQQENSIARHAPKKNVFFLDLSDPEPNIVRRQINHTLKALNQQDKIIIRLESPGGYVHSYGLLTEQILRLKYQKNPVTICVDYVAASGGYMAACVADTLICAPYAVIGSIGVIASVTNFHRFLKKYDIDHEMITGGEFKRTLTALGENTAEKKEKMQEEIDHTHNLFKQHVARNRKKVDIDKVATGEYWYVIDALKLKLVDEIATSDDIIGQYLGDKTYTVFKVQVEKPKKFLWKDITNTTMSQLMKHCIHWFTSKKIPTLKTPSVHQEKI